MELIILYQILSVSYNKVTNNEFKLKIAKGVGFDFNRQYFISRCYRQPYGAHNITIDSRICGHRQPYLIYSFIFFFVRSFVKSVGDHK